MIARIVAVALVVTLASSTARAGRVVGVLDVRGEGVSDVVVARFIEAVEEGLGGDDEMQAATLGRMQEMLASSSWSKACTVGKCLGEVRTQTGADWVVTAGLTGSGESYRYTITLVDTASGDVLQQISETCAACTVDDLASSATLATIGLLSEGEPAPVVDASGKVTALERRVRGHARSLRRTTVLVVGVALLAAGAGGYFVHKDRDDVGYPLLGAAAGLAVSGVLMLGLSFRF